MIQHLVLFSFHPGVSWDDPRTRDAERITAEHPSRIPEILAWSSGRNITPRPDACDFAVTGLFRDRAALDRYLAHPHHLLGVRTWRELATWSVVDVAVDEQRVAPAVPLERGRD